MFVNKTNAYSFSVRSVLFFQYAITKSSIFLALPFIESFVVEKAKGSIVY